LLTTRNTFQFLNGTIITKQHRIYPDACDTFQFLNGTIITAAPKVSAHAPLVSIPQWYDYYHNTPILSVVSAFVSIPQWYDYYTRMVTVQCRYLSCFNSSMVRLLQLEQALALKCYRVSIPQWYDYYCILFLPVKKD